MIDTHHSGQKLDIPTMQRQVDKVQPEYDSKKIDI